MATEIKFGTDGWRAIIGDDYTFENVRRCAQGLADMHLADGSARRGIVVGYDKRFESEDFAAAVAEVIAANGVRAFLCERSEPTPVISHAILQNKAAGGVTITASHNPAVYNGFKVRSDYGGAADPDVIARLEQHIAAVPGGGAKRMDRDEAVRKSLIVEINPRPAYMSQVEKLVDVRGIRDAGLNVVVDAMFGAGAGWFPMLIDGKTKVNEIEGERNPWFGGVAPEPISRNLQILFKTVKSSDAAVGLATDGDADRLGVCDENGELVDQLRVYSLLALYLLDVRGLRGPIVKTLSTSSMLDRLGEIYNVPIHETAVGFKYVAPKMIETDALIGGEESGGYAFRGHLPERDGIVAGLYILDLMAKLRKTPSELVSYLFEKVGPHYYDRLDVEFPHAERSAIQGRLASAHPDKIAGISVTGERTDDGFKFALQDGSWLLIRFSGTEPIMRIYSESASPDRVREILAEGKKLTGQ